MSTINVSPQTSVDRQRANAAPLVGAPAPDFSVPGVDRSSREPKPIRLGDFRGRWLMLVFYPRDFSFVCPTELASFSGHMADFRERSCDVVGISVDTIESHIEWLHSPTSKGGVGPLQFPLAADTDGTMSRAYGVWVPQDELSTRGTFIIDPEGTLQYSVVHNLNVGRSVNEVLRVLDALRTGGLCPASWTTADGTIDVERLLQPGRVINHYRIERHLGNGAFGSVFSATDIRLERPVALKILKKNITETRCELLMEARAAAKVNHPNICTVYAVEEDDGLPVIAMEFIDGRPLSELIEQGISPHEAIRLAYGIASGLAAAHAHSVVHGDLKPANVLVSREGIPKILDFGLSRTVTPAGETEKPCGEDSFASDVPDSIAVDANEAETVVLPAPEIAGRSRKSKGISGTPAYMSPEQAGGAKPTKASDVFSFGLVLYELLTGQKGLPDDSVIKVLTQLKTRDLAEELPPQAPAEFRELLGSLLVTNPENRPAIADVRNELSKRR
ncbi:MAG: protein kinase [Planctomycetota bacterium]|nr:protein kinase [Planctomycetota bacterium]MDA1212663.1 protein kinase [Planctomycetota bacterium]